MNTHETPVLETPRLRLRGITEADFPEYRAIIGDPEVTRSEVTQDVMHLRS